MFRFDGSLMILFLISVMVSSVPAQSASKSEDTDKVPWQIESGSLTASEKLLLTESLKQGQIRIEKFFGRAFPKPFTVKVFPNRSRFDEYFTNRWKVPKTQSWMVASGVSDTLTILSRDVWKKEASEHDPKDEGHYRELIAHEMVHVFHGQMNSTGDFEGMDDLGWLVEGLAVYVSGQLDGQHGEGASKAIKQGKVPTTLAKAWSGTHRYGVCGSMVRYLDQKYGREILMKLLAVTKPAEAMKLLETSEKVFLDEWEKMVKESGK